MKVKITSEDETTCCIKLSSETAGTTTTETSAGADEIND